MLSHSLSKLQCSQAFENVFIVLNIEPIEQKLQLMSPYHKKYFHWQLMIFLIYITELDLHSAVLGKYTGIMRLLGVLQRFTSRIYLTWNLWVEKPTVWYWPQAALHWTSRRKIIFCFDPWWVTFGKTVNYLVVCLVTETHFRKMYLTVLFFFFILFWRYSFAIKNCKCLSKWE